MKDNPTTLHDKLVDIQHRLAVPKGQRNTFGNYNFRNIEDIEAAVKPFLKEHRLTLTFGDQLVEIGGRVYVCADATLRDNDQETVTVKGWAREAETKKGMDESQITGAASSYARKYAAGGLFLIDNGTDADSMDNTQHKPAARITGSTPRLASVKSVEWMRDVAEKYVPIDMTVDDWIESVLTIKPTQVPQYKVKDAVDKINEVGMQQSKAAQEHLDTVITDLPDKIDLAGVDY